jgi:serine/threonine protein kinase
MEAVNKFMFCPQCGFKNKDTSFFCMKCGQAFSEYKEEAPPSQSVIPAAPKSMITLENDEVFLKEKRYRLEKELGAGGMGKVFLAWDTKMECNIVIKMLHPYAASHSDAQYMKKRFKEEAKLLFKLNHKGFPKVIDYFTEDDLMLIVMQYIEGMNLLEILKEMPEKKVPLDQGLHWLSEMLGLLGFLHTQNPPIIHRDVKPANIMMDQYKNIYLVDFGVAFTMEMGNTRTSVGTYGYASPESMGGKYDTSSDIYSLGATFHHLITGQNPQNNDSPFSFPPLQKFIPDFDNELQKIFDKMLAPSKNYRYKKITEVQAELEKYLEDKKNASKATRDLSLYKLPERSKNVAAKPTNNIVEEKVEEEKVEVTEDIPTETEDKTDSPDTASSEVEDNTDVIKKQSSVRKDSGADEEQTDVISKNSKDISEENTFSSVKPRKETPSDTITEDTFNENVVPELVSASEQVESIPEYVTVSAEEEPQAEAELVYAESEFSEEQEQEVIIDEQVPEYDTVSEESLVEEPVVEELVVEEPVVEELVVEEPVVEELVVEEPVVEELVVEEPVVEEPVVEEPVVEEPVVEESPLPELQKPQPLVKPEKEKLKSKPPKVEKPKVQRVKKVKKPLSPQKKKQILITIMVLIIICSAAALTWWQYTNTKILKVHGDFEFDRLIVKDTESNNIKDLTPDKLASSDGFYIVKLSAGSYLLEFSRNGYFDIENNVKLSRDEEREFVLEKLNWKEKPGKIAILVEPGALVMVGKTGENGEPIYSEVSENETVNIENLTSGSYKIEVSKEGYYPELKTVNLAPGADETISLKLALKPKLEARCENGKATLTLGRNTDAGEFEKIKQLDNVEQAVFEDLDEGNYIIKASIKGFFPDEKQVSLERGKVEQVVFNLKEKPASLAVTSDIEIKLLVKMGDEIMHDKQVKNLTLEDLKPGKYMVVGTRDGYYKKEVEVSLDRGESKPVSMNLTKIPPAQPAQTYVPPSSPPPQRPTIVTPPRE